MSREPGPIGEAELHAYVDGRLDAGQRAAVEDYLAAHPEDLQCLRDYQAINQGLHALFDGVLEEPVPTHLLVRRAERRLHPLLRVAGVAGWLLLGGVLGWFGHDQLRQQRAFTTALVNQAVLAHAVYVPEVRHPVEVDATQEQHLIGWLSKRLGTTIRAPRLSALGYELLGGRLLPADQGPAAQFMYQDANGRRLTLFVRKGVGANRDTAFQFAQQDRMGAFYWIDRDLGYALVGELDRASLANIAHTVYQELNQ